VAKSSEEQGVLTSPLLPGLLRRLNLGDLCVLLCEFLRRPMVGDGTEDPKDRGRTMNGKDALDHVKAQKLGVLISVF
jgi:hypothetical protein